MKPVLLFTAAAFGIALCSQGYSHEYPKSIRDFLNLIPSENAKAELGALLHGNIKESVPSDFDAQICRSLNIKSKSPVIITFQEVSFIFHYPTAKARIKSSQEMSSWWDLIYRDGEITRTNSADQVPFNDIGLVDPSVTNEMVEIDLLLGVAPLEKPQDIKYVRRSFRFVYSKEWKEAGLINASKTSSQPYFLNPKWLGSELKAYNATLAFGQTNIDVVKEFQVVYPKAFSYIGYFADTNTFQVWNSEIGLYDRYILTLQINVKVDQSKPSLTALSEPLFILVEVNRVTPAGGGRFDITSHELCRFSREKWLKVFRAHGDLSVLGFNIKTNQPVAHFDKALTNR